MIVIIDYGVGNLRSVQKAFQHLGHEALISADPEALLMADGVVLPGVGAFGDAMLALKQRQLVEPLIHFAKTDKPFLGICLGMQLLFSASEEYGEHAGLDLIKGRVLKFSLDHKVPHVGWNQLGIEKSHPLVDRVNDKAHAYFVHSYYVAPTSSSVIVATTEYFISFPSMVAKGNVMGVQFHPEKSSQAGLQMLNNFAHMCEQRGNA